MPSDKPDYQVDVQRVLQRVQEDPTGALLVQNAVQSLIIEDQRAMIDQLQDALTTKTSENAEA